MDMEVSARNVVKERRGRTMFLQTMFLCERKEDP